ncbi:MAG: hypothetical protein PHX83_05375 [Acidobacteriia bacterium]|nr:hypothetical protein [Terriglobia bacterium]
MKNQNSANRLRPVEVLAAVSLLVVPIILTAQARSNPMNQNPSPMVDTIRPHRRIEKRDDPGKRFTLSTGTLFLSSKFRARPRVPLIIHFHGAPWLLEHFVAETIPQAALITVQLGSGSSIYEKAFSNEAVFETMLSEALAHIQQQTSARVEWKSITLTSFSAGYGAVRAILSNEVSRRHIDAIFLADSLHTSYVPEGSPSKMSELPLEPFAVFAEDALQGRKAMWMTHSEVYPGTFASTTETADFILSRLGLQRTPVLRRGPIGMQELSRASAGNFYLTSFAGNSAPDHMDHLYAFGEWLREMKKVIK